MPRSYIRKTTRASYSEDSLKKVISEVNGGAPLLPTAKKYGIGARTLRRHKNKQVANPGCIQLGRFRPDINAEYESQLVKKIQEMEKQLFGLTTKDVRRLAFDFACKMNIKHRFNIQKRMAGPDWLQGFLSRHPELSLRKPQPTNIARAIGFNKEQVRNFFEIYKNILTSHNYSPMRVWNVDETGVSTVHKPANIIASKGARAVGKMTSGEKGKTVTVICAMNAAGSYIPPLFIFPRKRMVESLMNSAPTGAVGYCTESGWTDEQTFLKWLKHFSGIAKPCTEEKHIIILDGHHSHKTLEAIEFAQLKGIEMLTLPPHCTHRMQPLDRTFFKSLKTAYNAAADSWMVAHYGRRISFYDVAQIFAVAYNKSATVEKCVNGFRSCGLWPFDCGVFSDEDFAASEALNASSSSYLLENLQPIHQNQQVNSTIDEQPLNVQSIEGETSIRDVQIDVPSASITRSEALNASSTSHSLGTLQTQKNPQVTIYDMQSIVSDNSIRNIHEDVAITSSSNEILAMRADIDTAKNVLAQLCRSNCVQTHNKQVKKRSSERSSHITSSPYKKSLKEKRKNNSGKKKKNQSTMLKAKKRLQSNSKNEEWPCLVCCEPYANSRPKEKWVECSSCKQWAHEECTSGELFYTCHNCVQDY